MTEWQTDADSLTAISFVSLLHQIFTSQSVCRLAMLHNLPLLIRPSLCNCVCIFIHVCMYIDYNFMFVVFFTFSSTDLWVYMWSLKIHTFVISYMNEFDKLNDRFNKIFLAFQKIMEGYGLPCWVQMLFMLNIISILFFIFHSLRLYSDTLFPHTIINFFAN